MAKTKQTKPKKSSKPSKPRATKQLKKVAKTLRLTKDREIALDFAQKLYQRMGNVVKSIVLFGSAAKGISSPRSDIDIIVLVDDATIQWDEELVGWYRGELGKLIQQNPYVKPLHISTVRMTTWWSEMIRGEPVVINVIRWGDPLIDFGGFFAPLKSLLAEGRIKATPEMIYITLGRGPTHMVKCKAALLAAFEALYWAFVDGSHAALIAAKVSPPSPEHIPAMMRQHLVDKGLLKRKYIDWYREIYSDMHKILHGEKTDISGDEIEEWRKRADSYLREMAYVVKNIVGRI